MVWYDDNKINDIRKEKLSQYRAVMSQQSELGFPLTVDEVVMMGRYPHFQFNPGRKDEMICNEVMERMDLLSFRTRNYLTLSGGEKQRVQFARALTQIWDTPDHGNRYLFLDEPLNNLDINYQQAFLKLAVEFAGTNTVLIAILHDLNLALTHGNRILFMKEGTVAYDTEPEAVSADMIWKVFEVRSTIIRPGDISHPVVIYQ
jgi:heme transport system ATP-binding protein